MRIFHLRSFLLYLFIFVTLVLLAFEFYVFIVISRDTRMQKLESTIENYEDLFCGRRVKSLMGKTATSLGRRHNCPPGGIVTAFKHAPLGLNMWRYANLIAASRFTGLNAYVPDCMKEHLSDIFSNIALPTLGEIGHCNFPNMSSSPASIDEWSRTRDDKKSIVVSWKDLYTYAVMEHIKEIKQHFVFRKELVNVATAIFSKSAQPGKPKDVTYVGTLIRKTATVAMQKYDNVYPSVQFFLDAMDHYRRYYKNPIFITIAENPSFWSRRFRSRDVVILDTRTFSSEGTVLAILAHCNHSIIAFSGTPFWGAILSEGDAIVSLSLADEFSNIIQFHSNWKYLEKNSKSEVFDPKIVNREW